MNNIEGTYHSHMDMILSHEFKYMDVKEFREKGYLQEVNRLFFHPLGLALGVNIHPNGDEDLGFIIDIRDDPDGYAFSDLSDQDSLEKSEFISSEVEKRAEARHQLFGDIIQPIGHKFSD